MQPIWQGFSRNSELVVHKRSHTGEKPYKCSQLAIVTRVSHFSGNNNLRKHKDTHWGETIPMYPM